MGSSIHWSRSWSVILIYSTEKIDEIAEKMFKMGYIARSESCVDITEGPNAGGRSLYLLDPDGYPIELFMRPADA